jgi:hypothetical protein
MRSKVSAYWICQLAGWLFYAIVMFVFSYLFDKLGPLFGKRLFLSVILGFLFTHFLRYFIKGFKLLPPLSQKKWGYVFWLVFFVYILYSLTSSSIIQLFGWYDPNLKGNIFKRFMYILVGDSSIIIVWTCIYYIWHYVVADRKAEISNIRLESLVKELELKTIKSHINPHFIFNALNSIRALVDENPARARTAITELSNILRSSMQAEKAETTSLEKELNIVKDYLALEHIRFEDRLRVEYDIDEDTLDQPVPPMMLQTLVENAIKHGISKQINGGSVKIISDFRDDHHELIVQNTGKLNMITNPDGFGVNSTHNRLNLLFGKKAFFELKDVNGDTVEAKVIMPVKVN